MAHRGQSKSEAILKAMTPLEGGGAGDPKMRQRRLLADFCRLIGAHLDGAEGKLPISVSASFPPPAPAAVPALGQTSAPPPAESGELSPRLQQTLGRLLAGDSEKEAAAKLGVSQHTVHVYVKQLYRRFDVNSRAELLARWVRNS